MNKKPPWKFSLSCVLKPSDRVRLEVDLEEAMKLKEDQVHLIGLGRNVGTALTAEVALGQRLDEPLECVAVKEGSFSGELKWQLGRFGQRSIVIAARWSICGARTKFLTIAFQKYCQRSSPCAEVK